MLTPGQVKTSIPGEMDPALTAVISALVGGAVAASGGWLRQRYGARTAARLVYAELTRNTAPILYYRQTGVWPRNPVVDAAWSESSKDLARAGDANAFDTMYRGYAAFPALDYVLCDGELLSEERDALVDDAVEDIVAALQTAGKIAQIHERRIQERVERMRRRPVSQGAAEGVTERRAEAVIPAALLEAIAERGSSGQRVWAQATIASSPAASTLAYAQREQQVTEGLRFSRTVLDARGGEDVSAALLVRSEGDGPTGDVAVDEAFESLGATARFYHDVLGYDFPGSPAGRLTAVVHYGKDFVNCFWDGSRVVIGDGDGQLFHRFTAAMDVIAHELSHGVMSETGLVYEGQSGALLESLCDVFGVMTKQYSLHQTSALEAGWLVGDGLLVKGGAIRSMAAPGTAYDDPVLGRDPQPDHLDAYVADSPQYQSALVNCGIPNHAYYLAAAALPGPAWEFVGRVWFSAAMSGRLRPRSGFAAFAGLTLAECRRLFGDGDPEIAAIRQAWRKVGIKPRAPSQRGESVRADEAVGGA